MAFAKEVISPCLLPLALDDYGNDDNNDYYY